MTDISTWLLGVYDRQEKVARRAGGDLWTWSDLDPHTMHIIAHDPEKTLARMAALKAIVDLHEPVYEYNPNQPILCCTCDPRFETQYPCSTIRLLAAAEAHEPGYRQEWAVET